MIRFRFSTEPHDAKRPDEPRTVPETQRWLNTRGSGEWTEDNARHLIFIRRLVREGKVTDE